MFKKIVASAIVLSSIVSYSVTNADTYKEISCSTDKVFSENSCDQCFEGWEKSENSTVGWLSDIWSNTTWVDSVMYPELQEADLPKMIGLNGSEWTEDKVQDKFWQFTDEVKALESKEHAGYLLKKDKSVEWIRSTEGSSYVLSKTSSTKGENVGLLVYTIKTNPVLENGEVSTDEKSHKECVLFKGWDKPTPPPEKPKELPKTWPEHFFILLIIAMLVAFGVLRFKKG